MKRSKTQENMSKAMSKVWAERKAGKRKIPAYYKNTSTTSTIKQLSIIAELDGAIDKLQGVKLRLRKFVGYGELHH